MKDVPFLTKWYIRDGPLEKWNVDSLSIFVLYKLFYTHNRSKDAGQFFYCVEDFFENLLRAVSNPELAASQCIFVVHALLNSSDKNGVTGLQNSYPDVTAALKVLFELVYVQGSASFV